MSPIYHRDGVGDVEVAVLSRVGAAVGESPLWLTHDRSVLWVDMPAGLIHRTPTEGGPTKTQAVPTYLGAVVARRGGGWVAAIKDGFATIDDHGALAPVQTFLPRTHRMNDAKCDAAGRLWAGSLAFDFIPGHGAVHVLHADGASQLVLDGLTQPNGMAWSPDGSTFYLIDTAERELCAFDVDPAPTSLSRRRVVRSFPESAGWPDGMTIDRAGCLWVAMWDGASVQRIAPDGEVLEVLNLALPKPTSCTFAGPGLTDLVITAAETSEPAGSASLLRVRGLGAAGTAPASCLLLR